MTGNTDSHPMYEESPLYGYDSPEVQEHYIGREFGQVSLYFKELLKPGLNILDCGCGPGSITIGLAHANGLSRFNGLG